MARPKSQSPLGDNVPVRLPPEVKQQLQTEADQEGLPLSTYCRTILIKHCRSLQ